MTIGKLPEEETIAFLREKFAESSIILDSVTAGYIISVASGIPHYIQLMAAEIWQYMMNSYTIITKEIVDNCAARILAFKSDYYMELFDRQSLSRKQLLQSLVVSGKNIFSTAYIRAYRLPGAATLQRAIAGLVQDGAVEKNEISLVRMKKSTYICVHKNKHDHESNNNPGYPESYKKLF
jgi:hypothetical protein